MTDRIAYRQRVATVRGRARAQLAAIRKERLARMRTLPGTGDALADAWLTDRLADEAAPPSLPAPDPAPVAHSDAEGRLFVVIDSRAAAVAPEDDAASLETPVREGLNLEDPSEPPETEDHRAPVQGMEPDPVPRDGAGPTDDDAQPGALPDLRPTPAEAAEGAPPDWDDVAQDGQQPGHTAGSPDRDSPAAGGNTGAKAPGAESGSEDPASLTLVSDPQGEVGEGTDSVPLPESSSEPTAVQRDADEVVSDAAPAEEHAPASSDAGDLGEIPGVGPGLIWMLRSAGIGSLADLAEADADDLAPKLGPVARLLDLHYLIGFARTRTGTP